MNDKALSAYSKSCLTRTLLTLGISFALLVVMMGIISVVGFLSANDVISREAAPLLMMGCFLFLFVIILAGVIVWGILSRQKRNQLLDHAFTPLGLQPQNYLLSGRQYAGTYRGRQVNVYFHISGGRYLRTPVLEIYIRGNFRTRLGMGTKNILTRLGGTLTRQQPISLPDPAYEDLLIYPLDETWARTLLTNPQASSFIAHLIGKDAPGVRALVYNPEALYLTLRHFSLNLLTPDMVREWMSDLLDLAELAERQLPPTVTAQTSKMEQNAMTNRGAFTGIAVLIVAVVVLCSLLVIVGAISAIMLSQPLP